jgi:hypothetical protein
MSQPQPQTQPEASRRPAASTHALLSAATLALCGWLAAPAHAVPLSPLAFPSLGTLNLAAGSYRIDTDGLAPRLFGAGNNLLYTGWFQPQADTWNPKVAVFAFDSVSIAAGATVRAAGGAPLALLSRSGLSFAGVLDAAGRQGGPQGNGFSGEPGAGGGRGGAGGPGNGESGAGPGGGAGGFSGLGNGSWGEGGAHGGIGSNWNPLRSSAPAYGDPAVVLQGGSGGGAGGANLFGSGPGGGGGGGGVEFGALGWITFGAQSALSVAGGDFNGGLAVNSGGGSGGGVLMHALGVQFLSDITGIPDVDASGFSGGRITFLTASGGVLGNTAAVTVGANFNGQVGVISYGTMAPIPEPSSAALLLGGLGLLAWRQRAARAH